MAEIIPFKGLKYNPEKIKNINDVIAPPYDVILDNEQKELHDRHPNNIIRLILGEEFVNDDINNNRYTRSANFLNSWLKDNILIQEESPAIYVYKQEFYVEGRKKTRTGFIALLKLENYEKGIVLPHERTLSKPKTDRLRLLRACRTNFDKIFSLYQDPSYIINQIIDKEIDSLYPMIDVVDTDKIRHIIWPIFNQEAQNKIINEMKNKQVFIADGHHRYETSLNFRDEIEGSTRNYSHLHSYNFRMMTFINMDDPGLIILPAYRLIRDLKINTQQLEKKIDKFFNIENLNFSSLEEELQQRKNMFYEMETRNMLHIFGMYLLKKYYLLILKDYKIMDELAKDQSSNWKKIDVAILHHLLIEHIMELSTKELEYNHNILYIKDKDYAFELVKKGEYQLSFFVNPTKIDDVKKIALNQEKMPGKATYFYPKLISGLIMQKL